MISFVHIDIRKEVFAGFMQGHSEEVVLVAFSCAMRVLGTAAKMSSPKDTC